MNSVARTAHGVSSSRAAARGPARTLKYSPVMAMRRWTSWASTNLGRAWSNATLALSALPRPVQILGLVTVAFFTALQTAHSWQAGNNGGSGGSNGVYAAPPGYRLVMAQALWRHGARTPLSTLFWPTTVYSNCLDTYPGHALELANEAGGSPPPLLDLGQGKLPGNCRMGQLTLQGYGMAEQLGVWLRARYIQQLHLISPTFQATEVALRSTCIQRALLTLQGVTSTLWPQQPALQLRVNASVEAHEVEYGNNVTCPALGRRYDALEAAMASRDRGNQTLTRRAASLLAQLELPPAAAANLSWIRLFDTLAAIKAADLPLPPGATPDVLEEVMQLAAQREAGHIAPLASDGLLPPSQCVETVRMAIGPLLWRLQQHLLAAAQPAAAVSAARQRSLRARGLPTSQHRRQASTRAAPAQSAGDEGGLGTPHPKLWVYSGHDSTITPLLAALGRPQTAWPPFTASLVLELWQRESLPSPAIAGSSAGEAAAHLVHVLYNKQTLLLLPPGASSPEPFITLDALIQLLQPYTADADTHTKECTL